VDVKNPSQLNQEKKPLKLADLELAEKPFIRTMAKDMAALQKTGPTPLDKEHPIEPAKPSIPKPDQIKKPAPPSKLPVVEPFRKPILPSPPSRPSQPIEIPKPVLPKPPVPPKPTLPKLAPSVPPKPISPKPVIPSRPILRKELKKEIKPFIKKSRLKFVFIGLGIIIIIGGIGGFLYWWNYLRPITPLITHYVCQDLQCISIEGQGEDQCLADEDCQPIEPVEPTVPDSLIPVSATTTIELTIGQEDLLLDELKLAALEEQATSTFKRILVKLVSETEKKYADLETLISALGISLPDNILSAVAISDIEAGNYTLFFYNQTEDNRLGLVIDMGESSTLIEDLKNWEQTIVTDLEPLLLQEELPEAFTQGFQDNTYQDIAIRYLNFPQPDLSVDYGIVAGKLVITMSRESMYASIDALLAAEIDTSDLSARALATADWQTYQNEEYGFEVKYPADWRKVTEEEAQLAPLVTAVFDLSVLNRDSFLEEEIEASIEVFVLDNSEKKSLDNFTLERTSGENIIPKKSFKINGLNAIQAGYNYSTINMLEVLNMIELSPEKIAYVQLMAQSDFQDDLDIFDQILSTFKFISP